MQIVIPLEGQVRAIIRSEYIISKRTGVNTYQLSGDNFNMADVTPQHVLILPDEVAITEGDILTAEIMMRALPIETFIRLNAEETLSDVLGLVLRAAVADGSIADEELLRVQPALEGRLWHPGIAVAVGDVYAHGVYLWKCMQAHTTQIDWLPDLTPALWHRVEIVTEDEQRVWGVGIEYAVDDVVAYPDSDSQQYRCLQAHTSQAGWQPPNVPALWQTVAA